METFSSNWRENKVRVKVKFTLEQITKAQRRGSTLSLTSALDGVVGGQRHAPAALPPGGPGSYRTLWKFVRSVQFAVLFFIYFF